MWIAVHLLRKQMITAEQFAAAAERQIEGRIPMGLLAVEVGKLSMTQRVEILEALETDPRPFGQLAIELGYLSEQDLNFLLRLQMERATPLSEILVEMGAISPEELKQELPMARNAMGLPVMTAAISGAVRHPSLAESTRSHPPAF